MLIVTRIVPKYSGERQKFIGMDVVVKCPYKKAGIDKAANDPNWRDTEPFVSPDADEDAHVDDRMSRHDYFVCSKCGYYAGVSFTHLTCTYA